MNPSLSPRPTQRSEGKAWGHTLRTLREATHLTRVQLAAMAGVADSTIRIATWRRVATYPVA